MISDDVCSSADKILSRFYLNLNKIVIVFCLKCNKQLSRNQTYQSIITCPSCNNKMTRNNKRLFFCYSGLLLLGFSFFIIEDYKWIFQLSFITLISIGIIMQELVQNQDS